MDPSSQIPSKRKFKPGPPKPSRRPIPPTSNTDGAEAEKDNIKAARQIANRIGIGQRKPKETKASSSSEVTFQPNSWALPVRSFEVPKEDDGRGSDDVVPSSSADVLSTLSASATPQKDQEDVVDNLAERTEEAYVEPWGYGNSYYPTVLPWREPNSGDPELLDQEEFGNVTKHPDYDERTINSAAQLGLTSAEQQCKKQMFLFKIPDTLPAKANTERPVPEYSSQRNNPFKGLPEGFMGKMLVYKSGAVKLKLGDVLFDVSPGPDTKFHNNVAAIDTKERKCCRVGSAAKLATVTPDVESLLNSASDMKIHK